jgi:PBP1b-binding outer membrane lipoprotein LpoB
MKKSLVYLTYTILIDTGCSQSPESHCEQAIDNTTEIMTKDPNFLLVPEKERKKMIEDLITRKPQGIKECVEKYN